ncbi:hypothetical protein [Spiroplasma floricola]|uniref:hypothetical protein n=1 Tax=Spiroplasma floricola TaxID=216937 RepID=UPI000C2D07B4|nr:hypothetical protein [Spiroplasma floricola]
MLKINLGKTLYTNEKLFKNSNLLTIKFFPNTNNIPLNITLKTYLEYVGFRLGIELKTIEDSKKKSCKMTKMKK